MSYEAEFTAALWKHPGAGGWHFVTLPDEFAPSFTYAWGRAPVLANVDGHEWKTSVWREKTGRTLLAVPRAARGGKGHGDHVHVRLSFSVL